MTTSKNFRRVLSVVLAMLLLCSTMMLQGFAIEDDFRLLFEIRDYGGELPAECFVSGYEGTVPAELTIPALNNGIPVVGIQEKVFAGCDTLTALTLPESTSSFFIMQSAFTNCPNLETVSGGTCEVLSYTFYGCEKLSVVRTVVGYIDAFAFANCKSLKEISVLGNDYIEKNAFFGCPLLETVHITGYGCNLMEDVSYTGNDSLYTAEWDYVHYRADYPFCSASAVRFAGLQDRIYTFTAKDIFGKDIPAYSRCVWSEDYYSNTATYMWSNADDADLQIGTLDLFGMEKDYYYCDLLDENGDVIARGSLNITVIPTPLRMIRTAFENPLFLLLGLFIGLVF